MTRRTGRVEEIAGAVASLCAMRREGAAPLVGISGIDGSGKGWLSARLEAALAGRGVRAATLSVDPWHRSKAERLAGPDWGRTFYERAFRWEAMWDTLVEPLRARRSIDVVMERREVDTDETRRARVAFERIDVVLLEGIFLLAREHRARFDLRVWVGCSFETAMQRAIDRAQEGLTPEQTREEYERVYWPAQRWHFERDRPVESADWVFDNDVALEGA